MRVADGAVETPTLPRGGMIALKDITSQLRTELEKESFDKDILLELVEKIEPMAIHDWAKIKKLQKRTEALAGKSPEEVEGIFAQLDELKKELEKQEGLSGEKDKLLETKTAEGAEREKALSDSLAKEKQAIERLVLDAGITSELAKANVKTSLLGAAKALIREKGIIRVEEDGVGRRAVAVEDREGKQLKRELSDWMKEFLSSDEGKEFVSAKANTGSGAHETPGSGSEQKENCMKSADFWALGPKDRANFITGGGTLLPET